jgi:membrane-bound lytic murein transglycosylase B
MSRQFSITAAISILLVLCSPAAAENISLASSERIEAPAFAKGEAAAIDSAGLSAEHGRELELRGWDYLYSRLVDAGGDSKLLGRIFSDPRMPRNETVYFNLDPKESKARYRRHTSKIARRNALKFYNQFQQSFEQAAKKFDVPAYAILAIIQVETSCGRVMGSSRVFPALARLAATAAPENVAANIERSKKEKNAEARVAKRAAYLEETFLPHVNGTVQLASALGQDPLELRGSGAGAVGIPQFLPGNVQSLGIDADGNGTVDPFSARDAIFSVANFLHHYGWSSKQTSSMRKAVWQYNRSTAYIDTVLKLSRLLKEDIAGTNKPSRKPNLRPFSRH